MEQMWSSVSAIIPHRDSQVMSSTPQVPRGQRPVGTDRCEQNRQDAELTPSEVDFHVKACDPSPDRATQWMGGGSVHRRLPATWLGCGFYPLSGRIWEAADQCFPLSRVMWRRKAKIIKKISHKPVRVNKAKWWLNSQGKSTRIVRRDFKTQLSELEQIKKDDMEESSVNLIW